jgi:hypothetical protein
MENVSIDARFEITGWEPVVYDESVENVKLSRVTIKKRFEGELNGDSVAQGLFTEAADGSAGYIALEQVTGSAHGREGTFVMQHGGVLNKGKVQHQYGDVVPDTGTGGFAGATGRVLFTHDENGAFVRFDLEFEN